MITASVAVGLALVFDLTLAELPATVHPVAWFGRLLAPLDREWHTPRLVGVSSVLFLPSLAAVFAGIGVVALGQRWRWAGVAVAGGVLFVTTSFRLLVRTATDVSVASERDLSTARTQLRALAGRDATTLSASQVRSAAVESAAENLADGLVAPLGAFVVGVGIANAAGVAPVGALALSSGLAVWVKAINTMDSMLGYQSKPVGWAPARLDDAVMWVPARASALLLAVAALAPTALPSAARWTHAVPSPNSGWPMGVLAAAVDVRLEKPGVYVLNPDADLPTVDAARRGVRTVAVAGLLAYTLAVALIVVPVVISA